MRKLALLFPGQGSQYVGMGKELINSLPIINEAFSEASEVLGRDITALCYESTSDVLTQTENAQVAILTLNVALYRQFEAEYGITPTVVAGHSLGEYAALVAARVLTFADALKLVEQRARLMSEAAMGGDGDMLAVIGCDQEQLTQFCQQVSAEGSLVTPANFNTVDQVIVSGTTVGVESIKSLLDERQIKTQRLNVSGAFHSPLMASAAELYAREVAKYPFSEPIFPVIANVTGRPYPSATEIKRLLVEQLVSPVCWVQTMDYVQQACVTLAVELGPGSVVKKLAKYHHPIEVLSFDVKADRQQLGQLVMNRAERATFNQDQQINVFNKCMAIAVATRNTNDDLQAYEQGVVQPYNTLKALNEAGEVTVANAHQALALLKTIMDTKGVPAEEQHQRFNQVVDEVQLSELMPDLSVAQLMG
ncbi:ACP S-malonyltransferase [Photobacterium sp. DNB22_13_2]